MKKLSNSILKLFFPEDIYCVACGAIIDRSDTNSLCSSCLTESYWINGRTCEKCGKPEPNDDYHSSGRFICPQCREVVHTFQNCYACVSYVGRIREMVQRMKYKEEGYIAKSIGGIMADKFIGLADLETGEIPAYDILVPIPMHKEKRILRGYDQAEQIALSLGSKLNIPVSCGLLERVRKTAAMSKLGRDERMHNLQCAFEVSSNRVEDIKGKSVLLVDDVFTTGSSADACAEVLFAGGAASVDLIVFAHA